MIRQSMEWQQCIDVCSTAVQGHHDGPGGAIKTLIGLLDHEDVLVAYAAKEALQSVLVSDADTKSHCINDVVKELVTVSPECWRQETSGFRFQVLRQLLKVESGRESGENDSDGEGGEEEASERVTESSYLQAMLEHLRGVDALVRSAFGSSRRVDASSTSAAAPYSVQYEALAFLGDFVKQLCSLENGEVCQLAELSEQVLLLAADVFVPMDYASQPTFVTCAVLGFIGDFQTAIKCWKDQELGDESAMDLIYKKWLERCLVWLVDSSCTPIALQLLDRYEPSTVSSQEVFIGKSTRYPFLQQWLVLLSRMGVAVLEFSCGTTSADPQALDRPDKQPYWAMRLKLPSRQRVFAVLAEQDDAMIEVLNGLTRMTGLAGPSESISKLWGQRIAWASHAIELLITEYDPDLLFADLVDTLGRDHLVLLDLLVSNETQMLEYIMRYLRHLSARWKTSKQKLQANDRLECVMSVLIRLRLEIDKQVAADLFPYGVGPLTRRLLLIEQLYEEGSGDFEER